MNLPKLDHSELMPIYVEHPFTHEVVNIGPLFVLERTYGPKANPDSHPFENVLLNIESAKEVVQKVYAGHELDKVDRYIVDDLLRGLFYFFRHAIVREPIKNYWSWEETKAEYHQASRIRERGIKLISQTRGIQIMKDQRFNPHLAGQLAAYIQAEFSDDLSSPN